MHRPQSSGTEPGRPYGDKRRTTNMTSNSQTQQTCWVCYAMSLFGTARGGQTILNTSRIYLMRDLSFSNRIRILNPFKQETGYPGCSLS